jgi:hypothetical protein
MRLLDAACAKIGTTRRSGFFAMCKRTARFSSGNRRAALNEIHVRAFSRLHVLHRECGLIAMMLAAIPRDRRGEM